MTLASSRRLVVARVLVIVLLLETWAHRAGWPEPGMDRAAMQAAINEGPPDDVAARLGRIAAGALIRPDQRPGARAGVPGPGLSPSLPPAGPRPSQTLRKTSESGSIICPRPCG